MARDTFRIGDLTAVIGDNEGYDGHRAGYNGVHRLTHRTNPKSLFTVTGLNHEHIFQEFFAAALQRSALLRLFWFAPIHPDVRPD